MDARLPALLSVMRSQRAHSASACAHASAVVGNAPARCLFFATFFGQAKKVDKQIILKSFLATEEISPPLGAKYMPKSAGQVKDLI